MSNSGILTLPNEILNHVLSLSREAAFIHVCHRTWKELPSFIWYTRRLAALAFYSPVHDHVYSDYPIDLFERYKLPGFQSPLPEEERIELQTQLFSSYWFTGGHLAKTANDLIFSAIVEALRMLNIEASPSQMIQVLQSVKKFEEIWQYGGLDQGTQEYIRWEQRGLYWHANISNINLLIQGPNESRSGDTLPPWRMGSQTLRAYGLDMPVLPKKLIEMVGAHDHRCFGLLKLLYDIRTVTDAPRSLFAMSTETLATIEASIKHLLRSDVDAADPDDKHLKLLLLYDGLADSPLYVETSRSFAFRPIQCSCLMKTDMEKSSTYIRQRYYEFVINECNTEGFQRLMRLNPAVCLPSPQFFKDMFSSSKKLSKSHSQEYKRIYMEVWEKRQAARKHLPRKGNGKRAWYTSGAPVDQHRFPKKLAATLSFVCLSGQT